MTKNVTTIIGFQSYEQCDWGQILKRPWEFKGRKCGLEVICVAYFFWIIWISVCFFPWFSSVLFIEHHSKSCILSGCTRHCSWLKWTLVSIRRTLPFYLVQIWGIFSFYSFMKNHLMVFFIWTDFLICALNMLNLV